ncbi:MAG: DHH family phosphoesterase [Nitrososphaerota archaeon]
MADIEALRSSASDIGETIKKMALSKSRILILARPDADGIASLATLCKAIFSIGGIFTARFIRFLDRKTADMLLSEGYDLYVFLELAGGKEAETYEVFGNKSVFVSHHQSQASSGINQSQSLNAQDFGLDGSVEISGTGLVYLISQNITPNPKYSAWLTVIGALGDRQDVGVKRSLTGLNETLMQDAISSSQLEIQDDLLLFGRDVKPLHESIYLTTDPYIQGLTGNKEIALSVLSASSIELKRASRWRVLSELSPEERDKLLLLLTSYTEAAGDSISSLIGNTYLLIKEDEHSFLRDARDFAALLDATGRMGKPSVGLSVCLGDRGKALSEAEKLLIEYKQSLIKVLNMIMSLDDKLNVSDQFAICLGDGIVHEAMAGAVVKTLAVVPKFRDKVIVLRTLTSDGDVSFSVRKGNTCRSDINLGLILRQIAITLGGEGGGNRNAAGARLPASKAIEFVERLKKEVKTL